MDKKIINTLVGICENNENYSLVYMMNMMNIGYEINKHLNIYEIAQPVENVI